MSIHGAPLLCITPAPAIDRTAYVKRIVPGAVLRPHGLVVLPGGKGVNAARAALRLGAAVMTTGIAGGHAGRWMVESLEAEGLSPHFSTAAAESRTTYVIVDDAGAAVTVYEPPGLVSGTEFDRFLRLLSDELLPGAGWVVVAGSPPGGLNADGYARIVEVCRRARRPVLVDTSGPSLVAALGACPDVLKVGRVEAVEAGLVHTAADAVEAALALVGRGAEMAIVTDGPAAVAAADGATIWQVEVPQVEAVNAVGSGDAFNAGLSVARMGGASMEAALARGVAAGAANALSLGAGMLDPAVVDALEATISVASNGR